MDKHYEQGDGKLYLPVAIPATITFPDSENGRARKVVRRSNHGHVFKFASKKCQRTVELESTLEYDRAILLETDPEVVDFQEQPFWLAYGDEGVIHTIIPDFLVRRRNGSLTVEEVKPSSKANQPKYHRRFSIEEMVLAKHGYLFEVQTEKDIRTGTRLHNAKKLLPYRRVEVKSLVREAVLDTLRRGPVTGSILLAGIAGLSRDALFALVAHGHVSMDFTARVGTECLFFLAN